MGKKKQKRPAAKKHAGPLNLGALWRSARLPLLLIGLALLPRLLVLAQLSHSPMFAHPVIDAQVYNQRAIEIATGDLAGYTTFWQAPLYSYFLGLIYTIFGIKVLVAKLIQALLGAVCCYLVFRLADHLFDRAIAWIAYASLALCGPMIIFEAQLLAPVLLNFLLLMALLLLVGGEHKVSRSRLLAVGVLLGLAQITHGLVVVFLPFLFLWLMRDRGWSSESILSGLRRSSFVLIGFLPLIALTFAHNLAVDGQPVLVSANFGANFYLGNHPNYDSTTAIRPGLEWDEFIQQAAVAGKTTPAAQSSYFTGKAFHNIFSDLPGFVVLLGKKLHLLLGGEEIKRNLDIYQFRSQSLLIKLLLWRRYLAFPSGLFIPAALLWLGLFFFTNLEREHRREKWLLVLFLLSQTLAILLFFVATRYRLVLAPLVAIFAGALLWRWIEGFRARRYLFGAITAGVFLLLAVYSNIGRVQPRPRDEAEKNFYQGLAYQGAGQFPEALAEFKLAAVGQPNYAMAEYNLALALARAGQPDQADGILAEIVRKNPNSFVAHLAVGSARAERGELQQAEQLFRQALQLNPNSAEAHLNLGDLYREAGDTARALTELRKALDLNPRAFKAYNLIGAVYNRQGQTRLAEENIRKSLDINPSYTSALNNLATIVSQSGRLDEAVGYLERAHRLAPADLSILINLGAVRLRQTRPTDALNLAEEAIKIAPNSAPAYHLKGVALASLRRTAEARAAFQRALQIDPNFTPARQQLQRLGS